MPKDRSEDRHRLTRHSIGFEDADWDELLAVTGTPEERHEVIRRMVSAFLKRPGVKIPRRKDYPPQT